MISEPRFIEINGKQLEVLHQVLDAERATLVFLHEGLGCVAMWHDFPEAVARETGCNLLVYSRVGYGRSSPAELPRTVRYMHDEALDVLPAVLETLKVGDHILIGHSDGGSIALINGGGVRSPHLRGIITEAAHVFTEEISIHSIAEAGNAYQISNLRDRLSKYHKNVDNAFWGWNDAWLNPDFRDWNIEAYLPTIDVPVLVIQGIDDQYGTQAQVEAIAAGVGARVETCLLADCKHAPHLEQRDATVTAMVVFIKKCLSQQNATLLKSRTPLRQYPVNLATWLRNGAATLSNKPFLRERTPDSAWRSVRYGEMLVRVNQVSNGLLGLALPSDAPIAVLMPNSIDMAVVQLAAMQIGHPVVPISFAYSVRSQTGHLIQHILETTNAAVLVMSDADLHMPKLSRWEHGARLLFASASAKRYEGVRDFVELYVGDGTLSEEGEKRFTAVTPSTLAKIQFTSGSTNLPKGVEVTHGMMTSNQMAIAQMWPFLNGDDVMVDWLPWNHTFGGNFVFNMALKHSMTLHIDNGNPTPAGLNQTIANIIDVRPTVYFGVPASYAALYTQMQQNDALREALLARLKFFFVAAAALDQKTFEGLRQMARKTRGEDIPFYSAWGTTETAPCATLVHWVADDIRVIGLPVPGTTLKLVPTNQANRFEARVKGPNVTRGYFNDLQATRAAFDDEGFYITGDAVSFLAPDNRDAGILFNGRIGEDFKLASGVWVRNAAVRGSINALGKPYLLEVVLAAPNRPYLNALLVPNVAALRARFDALAKKHANDADFLKTKPVVALFRDVLRRHNADETGSSRRIVRFAILIEPLAFDRGETTDKGYVNQAAVLRNNAALVEASFEAERPLGVWSVERED